MKTKILIRGVFFLPCALVLSGSPQSFAASTVRATKVAVSQGISSPAITTPVNFSHGFLYTNPAVAPDFVRPYVSTEGTAGNGNSDYGAELGLGNGSSGLAVGYLKNECCDGGRFGAIGGFGTNIFAAGLGFHENTTYSAGIIFKPKSAHRVGLAADIQGSGSNAISVGAGYSYHTSSVIFALDASRRSAGGRSDILVTPGLEVMADIFSLSVSYDAYIPEGGRRNDDQIWFGLGIGGESLHFALYHDYRNDWSGALTFWM